LSFRKKLAYTLVLLLLFWGAVELVCAGGLWYLARYKNLEYAPAAVRGLSPKHRGALTAYLAGQAPYLTHDPDLGWTIRPHGALGQYHANGQGLRSLRDYAPEPPLGIVRVAAFGDSFTHASDVPDAFTWEAFLERMEPRLEVLNFGVPGYGADQAYLRYRRDGVRFRPHVVLLGFMTDDANRMVNVYRPFFFHGSGLPLAKPRYELSRGRLVLVPNPLPRLADYRRLLDDPDTELPRLGAHDWFFARRHARGRLDFLPSARLLRVAAERLHQPVFKEGQLNPGSEAFQVTVGVYEEFRRAALADGAYPIALLFPDRRDFRAVREGRSRLYQPLAGELRRRGFAVIDLLDGFERYAPGAERKQLARVHYTRRGYRIAAQTVLDELRRRGLTTPEGVKAAVAAEAARRR
jgi:hypothetical protein